MRDFQNLVLIEVLLFCFKFKGIVPPTLFSVFNPLHECIYLKPSLKQILTVSDWGSLRQVIFLSLVAQ